MSATLKWRPISGGESLPDALRFALQKRRANFPTMFDVSDHDYLNGLADAGVDGANELLELISTHGTIELYLDY